MKSIQTRIEDVRSKLERVANPARPYASITDDEWRRLNDADTPESEKEAILAKIGPDPVKVYIGVSPEDWE